MPRDKLPNGKRDMRNYTCDFCGNRYSNQVPQISYRDKRSIEYVACSGCAPEAKETDAYKSFFAREAAKEHVKMGRVTPYILTC